MPILITCASGGLAHKLKNRLNGEVILGDYNDVPDFMIKSGQILKLPSPLGAAYQHEMLSLCLDKDIQTIYPLSEMENTALLESDQLFAEYGIIINEFPDGL